jgi:hypothetical protein
MANSSLKEIGRLGQKRYGGFFYEEFLKELQGRKGVEVVMNRIYDAIKQKEAIEWEEG